MTDAVKRDIVFLLADNGMEQVITGFLGRERFHESLGCGRFAFNPQLDVIVSPTKDSGMLKYARDLLRSYEQTHQHAVIVVDADWVGSPGTMELRGRLEQSMAQGWTEFTVIVIEPELEAWIVSDNPHLARTFNCPGNYRQILADAGWWPGDSVKPPRPKEALEHLKRRHRARASNAEFGKLAAAMSVRQCQDPAFIQLRDQLRAWFPGQP